MTTRFRVGAVLVAAAAVTASLPAEVRAQDSDKKKKEEAKRHFEQGTTHYNLGRFDDAIAEFTKAFELYPEPVFLYNIAQSYRMKGEWERAKFFYKRYLSLKPDAANRADVEARIAEMDSEIAKAKQGGGTGTGGTGTGGTGTGGTGTGGTGTGGTGTGTGGTGTGTGGTGTGGSVAQVGGGGEVGGGTAIGGGGGDTGVVLGLEHRKPIGVSLALGPAFVNLGSKDLDVPVQFAVMVGGAYRFTQGKLGLGAGANIGYTPIPWKGDAGLEGTAGLTTLGVTGQGEYAIARKLDLRLDLGLGVTWFTGLAQGNPFTSNGQAATGPVPMFALRAALGVSYAFTDSLSVSLYPLVFTRSPAPDNASSDLKQVQQIDVLVAVGYAL